MDRCPDAETLAAFVDRSLGAEEKTRVEVHLASCEDCYFMVDGTSRFFDERRREEPPRPTSRSAPLRMAAAWAVGVLGAGFLAWHVLGPVTPPPNEAGTSAAEDLVRAALGRRLVEPRLSGGFEHAPPDPVQRGMESGRDTWELYAAASRIREAVETDPTPDHLAALGRAQLLLGETEAAVETLARATEAAPGEAEIRSDLAAAHYQRALAGRSDDFLAALEAATRAVELDPQLAEARFNRALALERLGISTGAGRAWSDYLAADPASGWAAEARQRGEEVAAPDDRPPAGDELRRLLRSADEAALRRAVYRAPLAARQLLQLELLPAWGRAVLAARGPEAGELADEAERVARPVSGRTDDPSYLRVAEELASRDGQARLVLARAHVAFGEAGSAWNERDLATAAGRFAEAERGFSAADSAYRLQAATWQRIASGALRPGEAEGSRFDEVLAEARELGFRTIVAQVQWSRALGLHRSGAMSPALPLFGEALDIFEAAGEVERAASVRSLLAEIYRDLGNEQRSWEERLTALRTARRAASERSGDLLLSAAVSAVRSDRPRTALAYLDERLEIASDGDEPEDEVLARTLRARVLLRLDRGPESREELETARDRLDRISDERLRARAEGEVLLALAESTDDPAAARTLLDRAESSFALIGSRTRIPEIAVRRAELSVPDAAGIEEDLLGALEIVERSTRSDDPWLPGFDAHRRIVELLVLTRLERGDLEGAWLATERGRRPGADVTGTKTVREALEPGELLLAFFLLPEGLVRWTVGPEGVGLVRLPRDREALEDLVTGFGEALTARRPSLEAARELHRLLLSDLPGDPERLTIVADRALHGLPFAALVDPASGRFAIEHHVLASAPSAGFLAVARAEASVGSEVGNRVAVVGEPRPDPILYPDLPPLARAAEEAASIASMYPGSTLLLGARATPAEVLAAAGRSTLLHVAGHAVIHPHQPGLSSLALAAGGAEDGALFAHRIRASDLSSLRLVTLSACSTASGRPAPLGMPSSFAHAFLDAGARAVVASLWPVDDETSARLQETLHREIAAGAEPASALRSAQLEMLADERSDRRSPAHWAGSLLVGG